jgi:hypothetical protein
VSPDSGRGGGSPDDVLELAAGEAGYSWWRNTNPNGYVLSMRRSGAPLLHRARCSDVDPDRHPRRMSAPGARHMCSASKASLRAWLKLELPSMTGTLERCPKCSP